MRRRGTRWRSRCSPSGSARPGPVRSGVLAWRTAGVGTQAAACFLQAGQPNRAVELWEHGRGVLLSQALDTRTDLTRLIERYPQLATEFVRLCQELDHTPASDDPAVVNQELDRRRKAADELDQIIATIRKQQGFDRFLLPPPVEELLGAASQGPIVLLNVSDIRSDALLLTSTGVEVVPLPELTPDSVAVQVEKFMTALDLYNSPRLADHAEQQLLDVLAWLWESLARPVLDRLGDMEPDHQGVQGRGPRVWWCPSGLWHSAPARRRGPHHPLRHSSPDCARSGCLLLHADSPSADPLPPGRLHPGH